ncbi:MAG: hypothetical protein LBK05_05705 [Treponema sp.]|nr:hypothetical protein [Treponema sp.]
MFFYIQFLILNLGASPPSAGTGLYACIFFAPGKKGYRSNPLRVPKIAIHGDFWHRSLPMANSISPPLAESNKNSAIHGAHPCRFTALSFCSAKTHESSQPASLPARLRQTPSIRQWRIAMETAASMPPASLPFYSFEFLLRKNS